MRGFEVNFGLSGVIHWFLLRPLGVDAESEMLPTKNCCVENPSLDEGEFPICHPVVGRLLHRLLLAQVDQLLRNC
jgi:hypothetical protein